MSELRFYTVENRISLYEDETYAAHLNYRIEEETLFIDHVFTSPAYRRKGYGKTLVNKAVKLAEKHSVKVHANCSFAKFIIEEE